MAEGVDERLADYPIYLVPNDGREGPRLALDDDAVLGLTRDGELLLDARKRLRKIVRQDLRNSDAEIERTLDMMQLRFREWEGRAF